MTNRIIEVPDISTVKTVDGVKTLFSLRNRKVKKGTLHDFTTGSGVMSGGDLYVLDAGIIEIARLATTRIDPAFTVARMGDVEVDWGDGTKDKNVFSHVYTDGVVGHDVVFYGRSRSLIALACPDNQITALDVSNSKALLSLSCGKNRIMVLNLSENLELQVLDCAFNRISMLDISNNPGLRYLACSHNQLTALDVSKHVLLTYLACDSNQLTQLDVSSLTALTYLACSENWLSAVEVGNCAGMTYLSCGSNGLVALDMGKNPQLAYLSCGSNLFLNDCRKLVTLAASLPNRPGISAGDLCVGGVENLPVIAPVCHSKNWTVN